MWPKGMLVGICWEKAFDTCYETMLGERALSIVFENTRLAEYFEGVNAQVFIALEGGGLSAAVIAAWYRYSVPNAMTYAQA